MCSLSMRSLCWALFLLMPLITITSCDDPTGPKEERKIGVIAFYSDPVVITVPDTVLLGDPFSVSVRTYGDGCVSEDGTEVESTSLSFQITPYDVLTLGRGVICPAIVRHFDHTATLTATQSGTAQITFHGRQLPGELPISEIREVVVK